LARQRAVLPGAGRAGRGRRSWPVGAIQRPQRTLAWPWQRHMRLEQRAQSAHVEGAVGQRVTRAGPAAAETRAQTEPYQRPPLRGSQHGIYQLEQAILAEAQVVVQLLTEGAKSCQQLGICHNPKRGTFAPKPEAPDAPGPLLCPISKVLTRQIVVVEHAFMPRRQ